MYFAAFIALFILSFRIRKIWSSDEDPFIISDTTSHLLNTKKIYSNGGKIPTRHENFIFDINDYPNGFYKSAYLLGIPYTFIEKRGALYSLLWDVFFLIGVWLIVWFSPSRQAAWFLLALSFPQFWGHSGRCLQYSERPFGIFWGNLTLFILYFAVSQNHWIFWVILPASAAMAFSSSKFAIQALTLIPLITMLLERNLNWGLGILLMHAGAAILTLGYSMRVTRGLLRHSHYLKNIYSQKKNYYRTSHYLHFTKLFTLNRPFWRAALSENPVFKTLISLSPFLFFLNENWVSGQYFLIATLITCLLTSHYKVSFLGEGDRYADYALFTIIFWVSKFPSMMPWIALPVFAIYSNWLWHWMVLRGHNKRGGDSIKQSGKELVTYFKDQPPCTIASIPFRTCIFLGLHTEQHRYLAFTVNLPPLELKEKFLNAMSITLKNVSSDFGALYRNHGVTHIIDSQKTSIFENSLHPGNVYYDFTGHEKVFENSQHVVYRLTPN